MENTVKIILVVLGLIYIISPVDFVPGPIDDMLVLLLAVARVFLDKVGIISDK